MASKFMTNNNDSTFQSKLQKTIKRSQNKYEKMQTRSVQYDIHRSQQIHVIQCDDPKIANKLRGLGKLFHLFHRRSAFTFYQLKLFMQMFKFNQQHFTIRQEECSYQHNIKQAFEDIEHIWKLKNQRFIVWAFTKISYQQKCLIEKTQILEDLLATKRINRFFTKLKQSSLQRKQKQQLEQDQQKQNQFKNISNISNFFKQFQAIPEQQKMSDKVKQFKSLEEIGDQIQNIEKALSDTYDILKLQEQKIKFKQNNIDLSQTIPTKRKSYAHKNRSRQFQKERIAYLSNSRCTTNLSQKNYQNTFKNQKALPVVKKTHHIIQPIIHNIVQPIFHQPIYHQPIVYDLVYVPVIEQKVKVLPHVFNHFNNIIRINYF